ncbi:conserved protein of unknown function [Rhodovastum atsumiense]|uniref:Phasin family protein n=1 Tax=Rhodovastum atsumiense TaxID=504468 RepID=A0A5M6J1X0_9PROT|nr:hypothetical protein [Rhodovastum atsumiense]KAA5614606.1 hypothetical protein F1189_00275 [Rhodovastum atsumiense]CAH2599896.1 conserved protein of unknown function [Rhodovastum atsumiense]
MPDSVTSSGPAEPNSSAANFLGALFNFSANPALKGQASAFLRTQADVLDTIEPVLLDWFRRRRESIAEANRFVAAFEQSGNSPDLFKAQQEWAAGIFQRLAADVAAYQSTVTRLFESARITEPAASQPAEASRGAIKPLAAKAS